MAEQAKTDDAVWDELLHSDFSQAYLDHLIKQAEEELNNSNYKIPSSASFYS